MKGKKTTKVTELTRCLSCCLMQDAGQEKFGATQCQVCGMVYAPADAADEATHSKFHQSAVTALKFPVSWFVICIVYHYTLQQKICFSGCLLLVKTEYRPSFYCPKQLMCYRPFPGAKRKVAVTDWGVRTGSHYQEPRSSPMRSGFTRMRSTTSNVSQ